MPGRPAPFSTARRAFLGNGALFLTAAALGRCIAPGRLAAETAVARSVRLGLVTDLHYADKPAAGSRFYRATLDKFAEAAAQFARDKPNVFIELGDLIDSADSVADELAYLRRINKAFSAVAPRRHYVLGNHCVFTLTKEEFLGEVGQARSFESFDAGGFHFVVLDACFRSDGQPYGRKNFDWTDCNLPAAQLDWLKADLAAAASPTIVFTHQRLDVGPPYGVKNAPAARAILEGSGKVRAVFQGHSHKNDYHDVAGIHYVTLVAMVEGSGAENNGYAAVDLHASGLIQVHGFRKQKSHEWKT